MHYHGSALLFPRLLGNGVAVNSVTHLGYVYSLGVGWQVHVVDMRTGTPTGVSINVAGAGSLDVNGDTTNIAVDSVRNRVYVADYDDNKLIAIDGASNSVVGSESIPTPGHVYGVAVDQSTNRVYVSAEGSGDAGWLYQYDGTSLARLGPRVTVGGIEQEIAVNPATHRVYVAGGQTCTLHSVDYSGAGPEVTEFHPPFSCVHGLAVDPRRDRVFVGNAPATNAIAVLDGSSGALIRTLTSSIGRPLGPIVSLAVDPSTGLLYIGGLGLSVPPSAFNWQRGWVQVVDPTTGVVVDDAIGCIYSGRGCMGVALDTSLHRVIVVEPFGRFVVFDDPRPPPPLPNAPANIRATAASTQATVSWDPPPPSAAAPTQSYSVETTPGGIITTFDAPATTGTIASLGNGTPYTFRVRANNTDGHGPWSSPSAPVTPTGPPGTPTNVGAVVTGPRSAYVAWDPPVDLGGEPLSGYEIIVTNPLLSFPVIAPPTATGYEVNDLLSGEENRFAVRALHESGINGLASAVSPPVTPSAISGAPRGVRATALASSALVRWLPPAADGSGGSILRYRVFPHPATTPPQTVSFDERSATMPGLDNGRRYTFTVQAIFDSGPGPQSLSSPPATPAARPPTAPRNVSVSLNGRVASLTWDPPADTGGSEIVSYAVRRGPDGASQLVPAFDRRATFTLQYRRSHTFTIQAANTAFSGPSSEPTEPVSADVVSSFVDRLEVSALRLGALVSWHAPPSNGGSKIDRYIVRSIPPGAEVMVKGDERVAELRGLKRGTAYTFSVRARNAAGIGERSPRKSEPLTIADIPRRPTQLEAACEAGKVVLNWKAPHDAGGSPILGYSVTSEPIGGLAPVDGTSTKSKVVHLKAARTYTFEARALNEIGLSGPSLASEPIVPGQCQNP